MPLRQAKSITPQKKAELSGHSARRGAATALGLAGVSEYELMAVGGWKSSDIVASSSDRCWEGPSR